MQVGTQLNQSSSSSSTSDNAIQADLSSKRPEEQQNAKVPPRRPSSITKYETEETKLLTTKELQRLTLLQQFHAATVQIEYVKMKKDKLQSSICIDMTNDISFEGSKSFF